MAKSTAILDIASDRIRLALIDTKYSNTYHYHKAIKYEGYQDGAFFDVQELFNVIASLITECQETTFTSLQEIIVGVPGEFTSVICQNVDYDLGLQRKINEKDIEVLFETGKEYISLENYSVINSSPVYYLVENRDKVINPVGRTTKVLTGLISYTLCENSFMKLFDSIAEANNVKFKYTSSILSQVVYVIPTELRDRGVVFIDLGFISTSVNYVQGDGILFSIAFSLGGGNIAADLTIVNEIPFEHSLELLKKINLNVQPLSEDEYSIFIGKESFRYSMRHVNEVAQARLEEIGMYILKAIKTSTTKIPSGVPVAITGSGIGIMVGAKEILSRIIGREVLFINASIPQLNKPSDSSLAALVMYAKSVDGRKSINSFFDRIRRSVENFKNKIKARSKSGG